MKGRQEQTRGSATSLPESAQWTGMGEEVGREEPRDVRRRLKRPGSSEDGFVLIIALVAMMALTILGIGVVTSASIDLRIAHNMRKSEMVRYASMAGVEHGRRNLILGILPSEGQVRYFDDESAASIADFVNSTDAILMETGDGAKLGTYTVQAVSVKCSGPPAGYSVDHFYSQFFDLHATGVLTDSSGNSLSSASAESALTVRKVAEGRCFKR